MLRGSSLPAAAVSVVRSNANLQAVLRAVGESRGSDTIRVVGRRNDKDPLALMLNIYIQQEQRHQSALQLAIAANVKAPALPEKPEGTPSFARKCSWITLQQLRKDILQAVRGGVEGRNSHCEQCAQIAEFLEHCFERPAVFDRTWSGAMVLSITKVAHFGNTLLHMAALLHEGNGDEAPSEIHDNVVAVLIAFFVPGSKKTE